jgi:hypothetical protein
LEVSAVAARVGIDTGRDLATSFLGRTVRDAILQQTGSDVRPNIHGRGYDDLVERRMRAVLLSALNTRPCAMSAALVHASNGGFHHIGMAPSARARFADEVGDHPMLRVAGPQPKIAS